MEPITVNYKVLDARAKVPAYATPGSAAADLCAVLDEPLTVQPMQRGNGEMSSGSCWGSAAPFPQTGRPGRRSGSGTVCAAFICRGRGIGRWLRRSWRICCF